jgi:hypothetical protein
MVSDRNVTGLVSLLKEMISDYTPDSALLKAEGAVDAGSGNSLFNGGSS